MSCAIWAERVEFSAAGPVADGLPSPAENVRAVAGSAAECTSCQRVHQQREHPVPCQRCGRDTFEVHAVCSSCEAAP